VRDAACPLSTGGGDRGASRLVHAAAERALGDVVVREGEESRAVRRRPDCWSHFISRGQQQPLPLQLRLRLRPKAPSARAVASARGGRAPPGRAERPAGCVRLWPKWLRRRGGVRGREPGCRNSPRRPCGRCGGAGRAEAGSATRRGGEGGEGGRSVFRAAPALKRAMQHRQARPGRCRSRCDAAVRAGGRGQHAPVAHGGVHVQGAGAGVPDHLPLRHRRLQPVAPVRVRVRVVRRGRQRLESEPDARELLHRRMMHTMLQRAPQRPRSGAPRHELPRGMRIPASWLDWCYRADRMQLRAGRNYSDRGVLERGERARVHPWRWALVSASCANAGEFELVRGAPNPLLAPTCSPASKTGKRRSTQAQALHTASQAAVPGVG
jgi:hypothetical protein